MLKLWRFCCRRKTLLTQYIVKVTQNLNFKGGNEKELALGMLGYELDKTHRFLTQHDRTSVVSCAIEPSGICALAFSTTVPKLVGTGFKFRSLVRYKTVKKKVTGKRAYRQHLSSANAWTPARKVWQLQRTAFPNSFAFSSFSFGSQHCTIIFNRKWRNVCG